MGVSTGRGLLWTALTRYGVRMRWNDLFADLEGQLSASAAAHFSAEVAEMTRAERASVEFAARIVASRSGAADLVLRNGERVQGTIADASPQWVLLTAQSRQRLIPVTAIASAAGLSTASAPLSQVDRGLSMGYALRALARDRVRVVIDTDAASFAGVIGAVGDDHCDVATSLGRQGTLTVRFAAIVQVRSADA